MSLEPRTAFSKYWPAIVEGWLAFTLIAFIVLRIAGSGMARRIAHSVLGR